MKTLKALIEGTTAQLEAAGIPSARWDAERLLAHGLNKSRLELYTHPEFDVDEKARELLSGLVARRLKRHPLQYLIGFQEFWGYSFKVTPDVLIPRSESELLVEAAVALRETGWMQPKPIVTDMGTGSGCLAVALACEIPGSQVYATDISGRALSIALENAKAHGLCNRIRFLKGDLWEPLRQLDLAGRIDLLVSNLPYIRRASMGQLQSEVRDHEPRIALDGGADGLDLYRRLLADAKEMLIPKGTMILEMGIHQAKAVKEVAQRSGLMIHRIVKDGAGIPRVMILGST
jgi:release factor glutamine methyltransferase